MTSDVPSGLRSNVKIPSMDILLPQERVKILTHASKEEVLDLLTGMLANTHEVPVSQEKLKNAILAREKLMSTGIGLGLAFPHVRIADASQIAAAAVLIRDGVSDYESIDSKPVRLAVMIIAPEGQHAQHLRLLSLFSAKLKDTELSNALFSAENEAVLHKLLIG